MSGLAQGKGTLDLATAQTAVQTRHSPQVQQGGQGGQEVYQVWVDLQGSIVAFHSLRDEALLYKRTGHVVVCIREAGL